MTNQHPIIPSAALLDVWFHQHYGGNKGFNEILIEAAQWGADQELEACCEWLHAEMLLAPIEWGNRLHSARRPKPPSLKYQALKSLGHINRGIDRPEDTDIIRRALEQLDD